MIHLSLPSYARSCKKTIGLAEPLREALSPLASQITVAFVYGSITKKTDTTSSDNDLMLISDNVSYGELFSVLEDTGNKLE